MLYLNPALWAGLALAALPLLIHLLGRRRPRRQPFSTLEFLLRSQQRRMRSFRLRRWLLLALRTLAVAALALAFVRPAWRQAATAGTGRSDSVVLLDLSASMAARRAGGQPLARARAVLEEIFRAAVAGGR
ncbi:MAG TPA: hypothetical protein ENI92_01450, partial [Bacteroidetes bacterium]|nr:hypothetical protein [Bacteroidota bacterium]